MNSNIYAARTATAREATLASLNRLAELPQFADVAALMAATRNKDKEAEILFEREALAVIVERVVAHIEGAQVARDDAEDGASAKARKKAKTEANPV